MNKKLIILMLSLISFSLWAVYLDIEKMRDPKTIMDHVNKGFDVNAIQPINGYVLLHYAVEIEKPDLVRFLIKKGANIITENKSSSKFNCVFS